MRICLVVIISLTLAISATAQIELGVFAGPNFANLSGEDADSEEIDFTGRTLFKAGVLLEIPIAQNAALSIQPSFLQRGADFDTDGFPSGTISYTLSYLEIPVHLKYYLTSNEFRPYLIIGPSLGFELDAVADFSTTGFDGEFSGVDALTEDTNLSIDIGLGFSYCVSSVYLFIEGYYSPGTMDIYKPGTVELPGVGELEVGEADIKSIDIQIIAGIQLPLPTN
jgi:hypothetical protein